MIQADSTGVIDMDIANMTMERHDKLLLNFLALNST